MAPVAKLSAEDHDTLHHVKSSTYLQYVNHCRIREFLSFEPFLGKEKFQEMMRFRGIGPAVKNFAVDFKRPMKFPDSLIVASHITEVFPDRYVTITSMWSLVRQVNVANFKTSVLFFDYGRNVPANLLEAGGVYQDFYEALKERSAREVVIAEKWEKEHPKKSRAVL
ncbi:5011f744-5173-4666-a061-04df853f3a23 [Sclerotinia trifoliorum]|uniref:5011f744-5173-4666-a061-04df853f3a23 n=1 Tax=Sclerotinia trifoliorum TaxID=28548 RepID=A0A8H2W1V3_9HELO|nr:5011f744-5173-4666-a061-04df853f3a23 [Sclerotinia trifoliorum]